MPIVASFPLIVAYKSLYDKLLLIIKQIEWHGASAEAYTAKNKFFKGWAEGGPVEIEDSDEEEEEEGEEEGWEVEENEGGEEEEEAGGEGA